MRSQLDAKARSLTPAVLACAGAVCASASRTADGEPAAMALRIAPTFMTVGHFEVCKGTDPFSGKSSPASCHDSTRERVWLAALLVDSRGLAWLRVLTLRCSRLLYG